MHNNYYYVIVFACLIFRYPKIFLHLHTCTCTCSTIAESPIGGQHPPLPGTTQQQPSTGQPDTTTTGGAGGIKLESGSGSSIKSGQSAAAGDSNNNKSSNDGSQELQGGSASAMPSGGGGIGGGEESTASIFLQTAAYLLDVHALKVHVHVHCVVNFHTLKQPCTASLYIDSAHNIIVSIAMNLAC